MLKYICKCGNKKELSKAILKVVDGSVRTAEAKCTCGKYMQEYAKNFRGFN